MKKIFMHGEDGFTVEFCQDLVAGKVRLKDILPTQWIAKDEKVDKVYIKPSSGSRSGFGVPDAVIITSHRMIFVESKFYFSNERQKFSVSTISGKIPRWIYQVDRHISQLEAIAKGKTKGPIKLMLAWLEASKTLDHQEIVEINQKFDSRMTFHIKSKDSHENLIAKQIFEKNEKAIKQEYCERAKKGFVLFINLSGRKYEEIRDKAKKMVLGEVKPEKVRDIQNVFDDMLKKVYVLPKAKIKRVSPKMRQGF